MRGGVRISARMGHTHSPFAYVYERIRTYIYIYIHVHDERTHSRCRVRNKDKSREEDKKIKYMQESAGSGKITRTKRTLCRIVVGTGGRERGDRAHRGDGREKDNGGWRRGVKPAGKRRNAKIGALAHNRWRGRRLS